MSLIDTDTTARRAARRYVPKRTLSPLLGSASRRWFCHAMAREQVNGRFYSLSIKSCNSNDLRFQPFHTQLFLNKKPMKSIHYNPKLTALKTAGEANGGRLLVEAALAAAGAAPQHYHQTS